MRGLIFTAAIATLLSAAPACAQAAVGDDPRGYDTMSLKAAIDTAYPDDAMQDGRDWDAGGLTAIAAGDVAAGRVMPLPEGYRAAAGKSVGDAFPTAGVAPIRSVHAAAQDDGTRLISRLPEPATWVMMILGFGAIGLVIRYGIRRSEARFTARVRRIAEGEEA